MLRRLLRNFLVNGSMLGVRMLVSLILTRIIIHSLGEEVYGVWVFALSFSITGYLSLFTLGIQAAFVKMVAEQLALGRTAELNKSFTATMVAYSVLGCVAAACLAIFARFFVGRFFHVPESHLPTATMLLYIFALQAMVDFPTLALSGVIEGLQRYDLTAICEGGRIVLFAGVTALLLHSGFRIVAMAIVLCGLSFLSAVVMLGIIRRLLPSIALVRGVRWRDVADMARLAGKLFGIRLNAIVYGQMDKAILAALLTTTVLTHYDVASRFHSLVLVAMGLVSSVMLSSSAELHARGESDRLKQLFLHGTKYSAAISVPVTFTLMVLARPLLNLWVGPAFLDDDHLVRLFLSYTLFWVLSQVGWNVLIAMEYAGTILNIQLATTALNLLFSVALTKWLGVEGVLWGTLIGNLIAFVLQLRLSMRAIQVSLREFLSEVILPVYPGAMAFAGIVLVMIRFHAPSSLIEVAAYGLVCSAGSMIVFVSSGMKTDEKQRFWTIAREWRGRLLKA